MEIWKDIPRYEGIYQVSNLGRVKSLKFGRNRILRASTTKKGYHRLNLCLNNQKKAYAHRLVMLAFSGESDLQVNHINGIKTDNRLENLEYCTPGENARHAHSMGLVPKMTGSMNSSSKLSEKEVKIIKEAIKNGFSNSDLGKYFSVTRSAIYNIRIGRVWNHVLKS